MNEEQYKIVYYNDEVKVVLSTCLTPNLCLCDARNEPRCCYTASEAHKKIIEYYQNRLDYLKKQTVEEFLHDQGFYQ